MAAAKHILVLTPYSVGTAPGPRSSMELWEQALEPEGIAFEYAPFETAALREVIHRDGLVGQKALALLAACGRRLGSLRGLDAYDAVLVYREAALIGPALLERLAARRRPIIYQLDDPLYLPYRSPFSGGFSYLKFFGKVATICRLSQVTIVNSSHHAAYARRHASTVVQIPSIVDGERYRPRPPRQDAPLCIGWSGSASTVSNLPMIERPLRELARSRDVSLLAIGAARPPIAELAFDTRPWRACSEVDDLAEIDIGLLPLRLNPWNRTKFYLKLVQYMALGIPAVCTPLGANLEVVEHGVSGFLAGGDADWLRHLERLVDDADLRRQMGACAAQRAHARYTLQANAELIIKTFRDALA